MEVNIPLFANKLTFLITTVLLVLQTPNISPSDASIVKYYPFISFVQIWLKELNSDIFSLFDTFL